MARTKKRPSIAQRSRAYLLKLVREFEKAVADYTLRGAHHPEDVEVIKKSYWNTKRDLMRAIRELI